ncbi:MAG TPA: hypothetical protein VFH03_14275 [Actinoplanes sp.]|nr:hypothetical protein [Actinoplanes sp.]
MSLAAVTVGGCARTADSGDTSAGAPGPAPSASALPSAEPSGSAVSPGPPPPSAAGALSISGEVTAGVEPDCLLLTGAGEPYLLVFSDESMQAKAKVGARITVTGRAQPGMMTTCQQGIPYLVTSVRAG